MYSENKRLGDGLQAVISAAGFKKPSLEVWSLRGVVVLNYVHTYAGRNLSVIVFVDAMLGFKHKFPHLTVYLTTMEKIKMPRISPISISTDETVTAVLDNLKAQRGKVPNAMATLAQSPAAFNGYHALSTALRRGRLTSRQREIVALATAQANACQYCLSGHTQTAAIVGLSPTEILDARIGKSDNVLDNAIATFAMKVIQQKGLIDDADLVVARGAGVDDSLMVEIVANVSLNTLTNYNNRLADTEIDFPVVQVEL
jgi:uncharacterized peroxidase-related enzyme